MPEGQHIPTPLVSVVIPTFNRREDALAAVESITGEEVLFEVIVVDDGSTDSTIDGFRERADNRVKCIPNARRKGVAGARNTGMLAASGRYIAFLDDDDRYLPGHLTSATRVLEAESEVGLVFGAARYVQEGNIIPYMKPNFERKIQRLPAARKSGNAIIYDSNAFLSLLMQGSFFNVSTVVIRRDAPAAGTLFNEDLFGVEDFDMWVRVAHDYHLACLPEEQVIYHLHSDNMSFGGDLDRRRRTQANGVVLWRNILAHPWLTQEARRFASATLAAELADLGYFERREGEVKIARKHLVESLRLRLAATTLKSLLATYVIGRPRARSKADDSSKATV